MRIRDYDTMYNEHTGGTETHPATDEMIRQTMKNPGMHRRAYEEGFSVNGLPSDSGDASGSRGAERMDDLRLQSISVVLPAEPEDEAVELLEEI